MEPIPVVTLQDMVVWARHISSCLSVLVDWPVQALSASQHEMESPAIDNGFGLQLLGFPTMNMFATVHNAELPQFMSLIPDPKTLVVDAPSQPW